MKQADIVLLSALKTALHGNKMNRTVLSEETREELLRQAVRHGVLPLVFDACGGGMLGGEAQGMVLPVSAVHNVDLARIAFGQTIAVTGIQLAAATAAAIASPGLCGAMFVAMPTAMPDAPLTSRLGKAAGRTAGWVSWLS